MVTIEIIRALDKNKINFVVTDCKKFVITLIIYIYIYIYIYTDTYIYISIYIYIYIQCNKMTEVKGNILDTPRKKFAQIHRPNVE